MKEHIEIGPRFYGADLKDPKDWDGIRTFEDQTGTTWVNLDFLEQEFDELSRPGGECMSLDLLPKPNLSGHKNGATPIARLPK